jgi:hypothetical protein
MTIKDPNGFALRRRVARHLRKFYAEWTAQLAAGTSEIWNLVEYRLAIKNEAEGAAPHAGDLPRASTQQPMQQQQTKASPKKA